MRRGYTGLIIRKSFVNYPVKLSDYDLVGRPRKTLGEREPCRIDHQLRFARKIAEIVHSWLGLRHEVFVSKDTMAREYTRDREQVMVEIF